MSDTPSRPWFENGLRFSCTSCGECCQGDGYVWVGREEIDALAEFLNLDPEVVGRRYLRRIGNRLALVDRDQAYCVFWDDGCRVYEARPRQCRTFPFWSENLATPRAWESVTTTCPGSGVGRLYPAEEIVQLRRFRGATANGPESGA